MLKTIRIIQQAAPIPAMNAGCFTTSEICWAKLTWSSGDTGFPCESGKKIHSKLYSKSSSFDSQYDVLG